MTWTKSAAKIPVATTVAATDRDGAAGVAAQNVSAPTAYLARAFTSMAAGQVVPSVVTLAARSNDELLRFATSYFRYLVIAHPQHAGSL